MQPDSPKIQRSISPIKSDRAVSPHRNRQAKRGFCFPAPLVAIPASASLTLPNIAKVAPKLVYQTSVASTANIAIALLDMGLACAEDADYASTPALFVERIFKRWIAEKTAKIKHFSPQFRITDNLESFGEQGSKDPSLIVGISFSAEEAFLCSLKSKIETLEKAVSGLGETAMNELYSWLCRTTLSVSPDFVFSLVQQQYWMGSDNEQDYMAEMEAEGVEEEEMEIPVTLADFEKEFPRYTYTPAEKLTKPELKLLESHSDQFVADVAKFLLSAPCEKDWLDNGSHEYLSGIESDNQSTGFSAVVAWNPDSSHITEQVCDDYVNDVYQSGATDLFAVYQAEPTKAGAERLLANLNSYITALTWADNAIDLLTTRDN